MEAIIKRKNSLGKEATKAVESSLPVIFASLLKTVEQTLAVNVPKQPEGNEANIPQFPPAKRLKPVLQCVQSLLEWIKKEKDVILPERDVWFQTDGTRLVTLLKEFQVQVAGMRGQSHEELESKKKKKKGAVQQDGEKAPAPSSAVVFSPVVVELVKTVCDRLMALLNTESVHAAPKGKASKSSAKKRSPPSVDKSDSKGDSLGEVSVAKKPKASPEIAVQVATTSEEKKSSKKRNKSKI